MSAEHLIGCPSRKGGICTCHPMAEQDANPPRNAAYWKRRATNAEAHNAELREALKGLLGIIEDPETRTIPQVVNAIKALKG